MALTSVERQAYLYCVENCWTFEMTAAGKKNHIQSIFEPNYSNFSTNKSQDINLLNVIKFCMLFLKKNVIKSPFLRRALWFSRRNSLYTFHPFDGCCRKKKSLKKSSFWPNHSKFRRINVKTLFSWMILSFVRKSEILILKLSCVSSAELGFSRKKSLFTFYALKWLLPEKK